MIYDSIFLHSSQSGVFETTLLSLCLKRVPIQGTVGRLSVSYDPGSTSQSVLDRLTLNYPMSRVNDA